MSMNEPMSTEPPIYTQSRLFELPALESSRSQELRSNETKDLTVPSLDIDGQSAETLQADFDGAGQEETARICQIREENDKLKQLAQYLTTYNNSLKRLIEHEYRTPSAKRDLLAKLVDEYGLSRRHVCRLLNLARSTCWYKSTAKKSKIDSHSNQENLNEEAV